MKIKKRKNRENVVVTDIYKKQDVVTVESGLIKSNFNQIIMISPCVLLSMRLRMMQTDMISAVFILHLKKIERNKEGKSTI